MQDTKLEIPEKFKNDKPKTFYVPKRYIFAFLGCFGLFNKYAMRVNLSVAMVAMVNQTAISHYSPNNSVHQVECLSLIPDEPEKTIYDGFKGDQYNWDSKTQGRILGSFFYGYIVTHIPGGIIAEKIGSKWLFSGGVLVTSILSLITPLAASWGSRAFIIVRTIQGLGEGVTYPAITFAIAKWSPKMERSRMSTFVNMGINLGSVVSMPVSGWLCSTDLLGGWPSVFYVFGCLGCIWFVLWTILFHESPSSHPSISKEEFLLIEQNKDQGLRNISGIPFKSIFTSAPYWASVIAQIGQSFGYYVLLTELPTYLSTILHFDIKSNGLLSAVPFIVKIMTSIGSSFIADKLRERNTMTITNIRRLFNTIGMFGPAFCLLGVSAAGCHPVLIIGLFTLGLALNGLVYPGFIVTFVDMSPHYAGTIYSLSSTVTNFNGILAPMVVGNFTASGATFKNWSYVFYIAAAVYIVTGSIFAIFSSAELQPWGLSKDITTKDHKCKNDTCLVQTKNE